MMCVHIYDRGINISGMLSFEVMLAHMFTQMLIVVVQDALLLIFALIVFQVS